MIKNLKIALLVFMVLLVTERVAFAYNRKALPSITISEAIGTTIYTATKTQRTVNVAWNAGSDYPYCEIYYTVNDANQTELGRGHDGAKPITVTAGNKYFIWMIVYLGAQGQDVRTVSELTVVAQTGGPATPPSGGASGNNVGGFNEASKRKAPGVEEILNAPFISNVRVNADSRNVVISFASTQSTPPLVEIGKVPPARDRFGIIAFPFNSGAFSRFATAQNGRYTLDVDLRHEELQPGTAYYYIINVFNNNRNDTKRPREQVVGNFGTVPQVVKVFFDRVRIDDDSDDLSTGECTFWFWANYGELTATAARSYFNDDMDSGHTYDLNRSLVINNSPDLLKLAVSGYDKDAEFTSSTDIALEPPLDGPSGSFMSGNDKNVAKGEFDLTKFPGETTTLSFRLPSVPGGNFKFVVFGHVEITRQRLGSTSSALETTPVQDGVHAGGRVKVGGGEPAGPSRPICDLAQAARARNSPAAPGLEAKCLEEQTVRAQPRVTLTGGSLSTPSRPICDVAKDARARNSPAAPGLEAQCFAQQAGEKQRAADVNALAARGMAIARQDPTATELRGQQANASARRGFDIGMGIAETDTKPGPGKEQLHDSLSLAEQPGFEVAVTFSLARNRKKLTDLAPRGAELARLDPLAEELRNQQFNEDARLGFDIGMAAAEKDTLPGPGKQKMHDSLYPAEQPGFAAAVSFSLDRNRNAELARIGANIARVSSVVGEARNAQRDMFYRLGFDIATGLFGDPALGAKGSTLIGPGALAIRDALSPAAQRGFNAAVTFHLKPKG